MRSWRHCPGKCQNHLRERVAVKTFSKGHPLTQVVLTSNCDTSSS